MRNTSPSELRAPRRVGILVVLLISSALGLLSCAKKAAENPASAAAGPGNALTLRLIDPEVSQKERLKRIAAEGRPGNLAAVYPLIRAMKHQSQAAFLTEEDPAAEFGLRAVEFRAIPPEEQVLERVLAVAALEKIGSPMAVPDLLLAVGDVDAKVRCHAARALVRFGCRDIGMQTLIDGLDAKIYSNETSARMLRELSGKSFGFDGDSGWARRDEAVARWRSWWKDFKDSGARLVGEGDPFRIGLNAEADARLRFFVAVAGQFQLKYAIDVRRALRRLGEPALPYIREGLESARRAQHHTRRAALCKILETIDHPKTRDLLVELLADEHPTVRSRAAAALGTLGGEGAEKALKGLLEDRDQSVVRTALRALGQLPEGGGMATLRELHFSDEAMERIRHLALFVASSGKEMRSEVLGLLRDGPLLARNQAYAAVSTVLGSVDYNPVAPEDQRNDRVKEIETRLAER